MPPTTSELQTETIPGVELLRVGSGNGRDYTREDIANVASAYADLRDYGYTPFFTLGHNPQQSLLAADGLPAAGLMDNGRLSDDGEAFVVDAVNVPKSVAALVRAKAYPSRSAELWRNKELIPGKPAYPLALRGGAWLGAEAPALKNLREIEALYHSDFAPSDILAHLEEMDVEVVALAENEDPPATDASQEPSDMPKKVSVSSDGTHVPMQGTHTHDHSAYGSQGGDSGHGHTHTHEGDSSHQHSHKAPPAADEANRDFTKAERDKLAASGAAMKDGSFPIDSAADLANAIAAFGRSPDDSTKAHIIKRAKALKATDKLPAKWPSSTKDGENNADDEEDSFEDIISDLYEALTQGIGAPFPGSNIRIKRTFPDSCVVTVLNTEPWDCMTPYAEDPEHYIVPYTREPGGEPKIGLPQSANVNFTVAPMSIEQNSDRTEAAPPGGETMQDEDIRKLFGLADDADVKVHLMGLASAPIQLSDMQALQQTVADLKLRDATAVAEREVQEMVDRGQIAGPKERVEALKAMAIDMCLNDHDRFVTYKTNQPKVVDYEILGDAGGEAPPRVHTGTADNAKANRAMGVSDEDIALMGLPPAERDRALRERITARNAATQTTTGPQYGRVIVNR